MQFYGKGTDISQYGGNKYSESTSIYGGSAEVKAYGNIMSLMDETGFATNTTLLAEYAIAFLFYMNDKLKDASGLLLPATTLTNSCYKALFYECTSLTAAPALPAKNLDDNCYIRMFYGCTSLTTAPALPATTMKQSCYEKMFYGCTSLTTAPSLPAKTLLIECYYSMFNGCTKLRAVTCLATNISASNCTSYWVYGVAESGTFTTPSSTNWEIDSPNGIPSGWTRLNAQ